MATESSFSSVEIGKTVETGGDNAARPRFRDAGVVIRPETPSNGKPVKTLVAVAALGNLLE